MIERAVSFRYLRRSPPKHIHDLTRPLHGLVARTGNRKPGAGHSFDLARSVAGKGHRRMDRRGSGTGLPARIAASRSAEHTSALQSIMRIWYAVSCLQKKQTLPINHAHTT